MSKSKLTEFLTHKPLYYKDIDYSRFPRAFAAVCANFKLPKIIHVVGTNGKGSTGRYLAMILRASGKKVGHYTSPHIFDFAERFWLDGKILNSQALELAHEKLLKYFDDLHCVNSDAKSGEFVNSQVNSGENFIETLSYFEWATLLAAIVFENCDEIVMEAGVGGEFDATNVFAKKLSVFTPIGLDHTDLLGKTLEQIATTKLNSICEKAVICTDYSLPDLAQEIAVKHGASLEFAPKNLPLSVSNYANKFALPKFLAQNLGLAYSAAKNLGVKNLDEIIANLGKIDLRGRFEKIAKNIWIDVGHNAHAASAIVREFKGKKLNLIYNAFDDKDVAAVLETLKPVLARIYVYHYESSERELATAKITKIAHEKSIDCYDFFNIYEFKEDENYLVFGSFMLINNFLKGEIEK